MAAKHAANYATNYATNYEGACPFCHIDAKRIIHQNTHGFAVRDGFPVSEGHSLIIPKRHVASFFDLSREEHIALLDLLEQTKVGLCHSGLEPESSVLSSRHSTSSVIPDPDSESSVLSSRHSISSVIPDPESLPRERRECIGYPESSVLSRQPNIPSSFNIGINDGPAAGQTVPHCHIHLIPRYKDDVKDARGGVRWVLPEKADYWSKP